MDISKAIGHTPLGKVESSIGTLYIFSLNFGHQIQLYKDLGRSINKCESEDVIRLLSVFVCYPEAVLDEGVHKPKSIALTREDVEKLSVDDLENIACIYLEGNDYLFKEGRIKTTKIDMGTGLPIEKGDIAYPKENGESCVKYLHRLFVIQENKETERFKKYGAPFSHFSDKLKRSIGESLAFGESLNKSFSSMPNVEIRPVEPIIRSVDLAEIERSRERQRLKPFKELNERLDRLIETSERSSEFQIETHKVQTLIADELKASGDSAAHYSKDNISLSRLVILLTLIGMVLSLYFHISNQSDSSNKDKIISGQAAEITNVLKDIKGNLAESHDSQEPLRNADYKRLGKTIRTQQQIIHDLQLQKETQAGRLNLLEKRLAEMEKKIGQYK
jgi:hypothetical protein